MPDRDDFSRLCIRSFEVMALKRKWQKYPLLALLALLIVDNQTARQGVTQGLEICFVTLVPALFPFLILTGLLTAQLSSIAFPGSRAVEKILRIPAHSAGFFLVGLLGGYPIGAGCICQARKDGRLSAENCRRMLGFCSNAGPAFLFGMGLTLFPHIRYCFAIWAIQLLSALITGMLTPGGTRETVLPGPETSAKHGGVLRQSIAAMATVCGWVICFRVAITYVDKWVLGNLPPVLQAAIGGILELANGCCALKNIADTGSRFVLFSGLMAFGGLCVAMQTADLARDAHLDLGIYLPAKACQAGIATVLAALIYPGNVGIKPGWVLLAAIPIVCYPIFLGTKCKKITGIYQPVGV